MSGKYGPRNFDYDGYHNPRAFEYQPRRPQHYDGNYDDQYQGEHAGGYGQGHDFQHRQNFYKNNGRDKRTRDERIHQSQAEKSYEKVNFHRGMYSRRSGAPQNDKKKSPKPKPIQISKPQLEQLTVDIAAQMSKTTQQKSPEPVTVSTDVIIGLWDDVVKNQQLLEIFLKTLGKNVAPGTIVIPSKGLELPKIQNVLKKKDGVIRECRHMVFRFKSDWFSQVVENQTIKAKFLGGTVKIDEVFDAIYKKTKDVIEESVKFYKPFGRVYVVCQTNSPHDIDSITACVACSMGHTIIQLNNHGPEKFGEGDLKNATDEKYCETFAKRLGQQICNNRFYVRKDETKIKALSPNNFYAMPIDMSRVMQQNQSKSKKSK